MGDTFTVKVEDLTKGSNVRVRVLCDYCKTEYDIAWYSYVSLRKKRTTRIAAHAPNAQQLKLRNL